MLKPGSAPGEARVAPVRSAVAVAAAELQVARRVVRTWVFAALALGVGLAIYHVWAVEHSMMGRVAHPRFAMPSLGFLTLWTLLAGIVFLAFDIPVRDQRERVADVLDSRPFANVALMGGRLVAVALAAWLPLAVLAVALQIGGVVVEQLDARAGVPLEPVSLTTFMFLDAPPALLFWGALVIFLATVVRNRLVVVVAALALLAIHFWAILNTPLYLLPVVSGIANLGLPGSEILARTVSGMDLIQRASVLFLGAGLLVTAASILPRRDASSRTPGLAWGAALLGVGACGIGGLAWHIVEERAERLAWAEAHETALDLPRVDVERLSGTVSIEPARNLVVDVDLDLRAPGTSLQILRFSLNPDMVVQSVRMGDAEVPYSHELGLLTVTPARALRPGGQARLSIRAQGIPDPRFGYLDSAVWALDETLLGMPIALRGDQASIFDADYVALTPAVAWLPMSGPNYAIDDPARRAPDFHDIDLVVRVPEGWHVAGPGRAVEDGAWRFHPTVPLTGVPLIAGRFERRALTVADVEYELLVHPRHMGSVEYFSQGDGAELAADILKQQIQWAGASLPYPHAVFSVVEVPGQLRRYGGGRIMDTVQALPGVQMLPEHGFPTRRYAAEPSFAGGPSQAQRFQLFSTLARGPFGIPAVAGAARNMVPFHMSVSGEGAVAANYLLESLATRVVEGLPRTVAPAHWLRIGQSPGLSFPMRVLNRLMGTATFSFGWYQFFGMNLEDRSNELSFAGVDAMASTEGADILIHKGNLLALAINSVVGGTGIAEFLATMRERHGGRTFTLADFIAGLAEVDPALASTIEHCMRENSLPGFLLSDARVFRLPDDENGTPRYQAAIHVRNDEPVPGVAGFGMRNRFGSEQWGEFVNVPANTTLEFGIVSEAIPTEVRVETWLSQNARVVRLAAPRVDPELIVAEEPLIGVRPSAWQPPDLGIVVDDLDPGFSYVSPPEKGFRFGSAPEEDEKVMSEYYWGARVPGWHRQGDPLTMSWGKYRRTLTRILAGTGEGSATFAAELPSAGTWRLYYHLPGASASEGHAWRASGWNPGDDFGTYNLEIVTGEVRMPVEYDARTAIPGWNDVGTFELPAGPVRVTVSDATDGQAIVADAVRWQVVDDPHD